MKILISLVTALLLSNSLIAENPVFHSNENEKNLVVTLNGKIIQGDELNKVLEALNFDRGVQKALDKALTSKVKDDIRDPGYGGKAPNFLK